MFSFVRSGCSRHPGMGSGIGLKHSNIMIVERHCQTLRMETAETKTIQVVLNGEPRTVPAGFTVDTFLVWLQMDPSRVAVELNRVIVRKPDWARLQVLDGAQLE